MANTKSTQHEIDLTSELNLNKFKADIKAYNGFNERNAPYYGGCLSPLYIKEDGQYSSTDKIYRGHLYSMNNGTVYKDGEVIMNISGQSSFKKTVYRDSDCLDYFGFNGDENATAIYKVCKISNGIQITMGSTSSVYTIENADYDKSRFVVDWNNRVTFLIIGYYQYNALRVKLYVHKWGQPRIGQKWPTLGVEVIDDVTFPTKVPSWIINDRKIVEQFELGTRNLYFTYNGIAFHYYYQVSSSRVLEVRTINEFRFIDYTYIDSNKVLHKGASYNYTYDYLTGNVTVTGQYPEDPAHPYENLHSFSDTYSSFLAFARSQYSYVMPVSTEELGGVNVIIKKEYSYDENNSQVNKAFLSFGDGGQTYSFDVPIINSDYDEYNELINFDEAKKCRNIFTYKDLRQNKLGYLSLVSLIKISETNKKLCKIVSVKGDIPSSEEYPVNIQELETPITSTSIDDTLLPVPSGRQCTRLGYSPFRILGTNTGIVQGISYGEQDVDIGPDEGLPSSYRRTGYKGNIGTLLCSWGAIDGSKNVYISYKDVSPTATITFQAGAIYYDQDEEAWVSVTLVDQIDNNFTIIGDYIVINTTDYYNCVNINTGKIKHWASDWNNRFIAQADFYVSSIYFAFEESNFDTVLVSTAQNTNWLSDNLSSALFPPEIALFYKDASITLEGIKANVPDSNKVELYYDYKYVRNLDGSYNTSLDGTTYPSSETRYNIPLLFDVNNNLYNLITVNFGSSSFVIMYYDNKPRYQYFASSIATFDIIFVIQGQVYGIYDNKIYSITYGQNTIQRTNLIIPIDGLQYIGSTIYNAYFYSPTIKAIYQFGADNNLTIFAQADTFDEILGASYVPNTGSIIIGVKEGDNNYYTYVLNERFGIYRIKGIGAVTDAGWMEETNAILCFAEDANAYELSYEAMKGFEKKNIILDTSFYGAGSNVVSVNDCWYIRITDPEHGEGEVKVSVSTLTDVGRTTESITKPIKKNMWDDVTDTYYLRFQPRMQRAVGVSLHIESPFKIGYIGVGATPETLQLSKGSI